MSYYPTIEEINQLGFKPAVDEDGEAYYWRLRESPVSGRSGELELHNDEGQALLVEMLPDGIHAWATCECFEHLEAACNTAFDSIAEGR